MMGFIGDDQRRPIQAGNGCLEIRRNKGGVGGDNGQTFAVTGAEIHHHAVQQIKPAGLALIGQNRSIAELLALLVPLINKVLIGNGDNDRQTLLPLVQPHRGGQSSLGLAGAGSHLKQTTAIIVKPTVNASTGCQEQNILIDS